MNRKLISFVLVLMALAHKAFGQDFSTALGNIVTQGIAVKTNVYRGIFLVILPIGGVFLAVLAIWSGRRAAKDGKWLVVVMEVLGAVFCFTLGGIIGFTGN